MTEPTNYEAFLKLETGTHSTRINQLLVTRDSKTLITAGEKTIRVWDVETKKQLRMLLGQIGAGADGNIQRMALSRDDKYVAALAWLNPDGTHGDLERETDLRVYELATGNLQAAFRYPGTLHDLEFSPDGKYLALVGSPKEPVRRGYIQLYEASAILRGFGAMPAPLAADALYDNDAVLPACVRFVPENVEQASGYRLVVATWVQHPGQEPEYSGGLLWYAFTLPSGLVKLPASRETEEQVTPNSLAVSREYVIMTGEPKKLYCYDHRGKLVTAVVSESVPAAPVFSQDDKRLIVGQGGDSALVEVSVYDVMLGQFRLKSTYHGHDAEVAAVGFLRDGTAVSAGGDQNAIHFWNASRFEGEQTAVIKGVGRTVHAVGINAAEQIGIGNYDDLRAADGSIILQRVFDLRSMTLNALSMTEAAAFRRAQNRAGEQWLELKPQDADVGLYLLPEGQALTDAASDAQDRVTTFGFTEKGTIVMGASDGTLQVRRRGADGRYPQAERFLVGHEAALRDHVAAGRWLVSSGTDQVLRLWFMEDVEQDSTEDLHPALNLFVGSDDEWVIWSKSGYYNASQRGDRRFGYHVNRGPHKEALYFTSDRFIKAFFRPDIIQAILQYGSEERALATLAKQDHAVAALEVAEILPPIVELAENGVVTTKKDVTLTFTVGALNPKQPVTRVWIVRNEQFAWESRKPKNKYEVTLKLLPGRNRIKILAETATAKSIPVLQTIAGPEPRKASPKGSQKRTRQKAAAPTGKGRPEVRGSAAESRRAGANVILGDGDSAVPRNGTLYLLAVGVSELKTPRPDKGFHNLQFAHEDAIAIYNAFGRTKLTGTADKKAALHNGAFRSVEATLLLNKEATKAAILRAVEKICKKIKARAKKRGDERDVLLVFLSGHGVRRTDAKTHDQELLFWNYDLNFDNTRGTGLSLIALGEKITSVAADVILTTDACHSGMAGSEVVRGLDPNELAKRIYAINERGMYILNAARSEEVAIESGRKDIQHGIFTKSILETLGRDNEVSMLQLIASVQQRVQYYTDREQTPVCRMYGDLLPLVVYQK